MFAAPPPATGKGPTKTSSAHTPTTPSHVHTYTNGSFLPTPSSSAFADHQSGPAGPPLSEGYKSPTPVKGGGRAGAFGDFQVSSDTGNHRGTVNSNLEGGPSRRSFSPSDLVNDGEAGSRFVDLRAQHPGAALASAMAADALCKDGSDGGEEDRGRAGNGEEQADVSMCSACTLSPDRKAPHHASSATGDLASSPVIHRSGGDPYVPSPTPSPILSSSSFAPPGLRDVEHMDLGSGVTPDSARARERAGGEADGHADPTWLFREGLTSLDAEDEDAVSDGDTLMNEETLAGIVERVKGMGIGEGATAGSSSSDQNQAETRELASMTLALVQYAQSERRRRLTAEEKLRLLSARSTPHHYDPQAQERLEAEMEGLRVQAAVLARKLASVPQSAMAEAGQGRIKVEERKGKGKNGHWTPIAPKVGLEAPIRLRGDGADANGTGADDADVEDGSTLPATIKVEDELTKQNKKLQVEKRYYKHRLRDAEHQISRLDHELRSLRSHLLFGGPRIVSKRPETSDVDPSRAAPETDVDRATSDVPGNARRSLRPSRKSYHRRRAATMGDAEAEHLLLAARRIREVRREAPSAELVSQILAHGGNLGGIVPSSVRRKGGTTPNEPSSTSPGKTPRRLRNPGHQRTPGGDRYGAERVADETPSRRALGLGFGIGGPPGTAGSGQMQGSQTSGWAAHTQRLQNLGSSRVGATGGASTAPSASQQGGSQQQQPWANSMDELLQAAQTVLTRPTTPTGQRLASSSHERASAKTLGGPATVYGSPKRRRTAAGAQRLSTPRHDEVSGSSGGEDQDGDVPGRKTRRRSPSDMLPDMTSSPPLSFAREEIGGGGAGGPGRVREVSALDLLADQAAQSQNSSSRHSQATDDGERSTSPPVHYASDENVAIAFPRSGGERGEAETEEEEIDELMDMDEDGGEGEGGKAFKKKRRSSKAVAQQGGSGNWNRESTSPTELRQQRVELQRAKRTPTQTSRGVHQEQQDGEHSSPLRSSARATATGGARKRNPAAAGAGSAYAPAAASQPPPASYATLGDGTEMGRGKGTSVAVGPPDSSPFPSLTPRSPGKGIGAGGASGRRKASSTGLVAGSGSTPRKAGT